MLFSQSQVDALVTKAVKESRSEEMAIFEKLEVELRKAYHPATEDSFDGKEVERLLTQLDIVRTEG